MLQIQKKLYEEKNLSIATVDEIYKRVASTSFRNNLIENYILGSTDIPEDNIPSLCLDYKNNFSHLEWKKICFPP